MADAIARRLAEKKVGVGVIGLGYVGLPLAVSFAEVGWQVVGFDVSDAVVSGLNAGRTHIDDVAASRIAPLVSSGTFRASSTGADLG